MAAAKIDNWGKRLFNKSRVLWGVPLCWALALLCPFAALAQPLALDPNLSAEFTHAGGPYVTGTAVQSSGRLVVSGYFQQVNGVDVGKLVRLDGQGTLDGGFTPPGVFWPSQVLVQSDDKLLVPCAYLENNGSYYWALVRLNADGAWDQAYNPGFTGYSVEGVILQPDDKLVIGGDLADWAGHTVVGDDWLGVARLNSDGTKDDSFTYAVANGGTHAYPDVFALQEDGKIVVGGDFNGINGTARNRVARLNSDGSLDETFDPGDGPSAEGDVEALAVQGDGKIVVGGVFSTFGGEAHSGIVRLNSDGSPDTGFAAQLSKGGATPSCFALAVLPDGRIAVGGDFTEVNGQAVSNLAVLNPDGTLDETSIPVGGGTDALVSHLNLHAGSQLLVGGRFTQLNGQARSCLARFTVPPEAGADLPGTLFDQSPGPKGRIGLPQGQVNTATLGLVAKGTLFRMRTLGPGVDLTLTYTAWPGLPTGLFGRWWRSTYETSLQVSGQQAELTRGSGRRLAYSTTGDLSLATPGDPVAYTPPQGSSDRLAFHGSYYLWTEMASRHVYRYEPSVGDPDTYRLTQVADKNGNAVLVTYYDGTDRIRYVTGPAGRKLTFTYSGDYCTGVAMPDGRSIAAAYDGDGNLTSLTDMAGYVGAYTYDADGYLTQMTTAGQATDYTHADRDWMEGKYVSQVDYPDGETVSFEAVNEDGSSTKRVGGDGQETVYTSEAGKTASVRDPTGGLRKLEWVGNLPAAFEDPSGGRWESQYDDSGNLIRMIDAYGRWWDYSYDADDRLKSRKDPLGNTWSYTYDANGNLIRLTDPSGGVTKLAYDPQGWLIQVTDPNDEVTGYARDSYGNLVTITDPLGHQTAYGYSVNDAYLRPYKLTDARGKEKYLYYDDNDRLARIGYGPAPHFAQVVNTYDAMGQLSHRDELNNLYQAERNGQGLLTKLTDPLNWMTFYAYDGEGRPTTVTGPSSRTTVTSYDEDGRVIKVEDPLHHYIQRTWDAAGKPATFEDQNRRVTRFTHDLNGRLTALRDPLDNVVSHTYDTAGRRTGTTNARGQAMAFTHDGNDRMLTRDLGGGLVESWTYDPAGNLTAATGSEGTTAYTYDARNQVVGISYPDGTAVSMTRDAAGNLASITYPGGLTVSYQYDDFCRLPLPSWVEAAVEGRLIPRVRTHNRPTSITWSGGSMTLSHDVAGNLTKVERLNGVTTDYTYDARQRVATLAHAKGATSVVTLGYAYDAWGNPQAMTTDNPLAPPVYTATVAASFDWANQVTSRGGVGYTYDQDGNLSATDDGFSAGFDRANRPTAVTRAGQAQTIAWSPQDNPANVSGGGVGRLHHDHLGRVIFTTDGAATLTAIYIYEGARMAAMVDASGAVYYFHHDRLGSALALTSATGAVVRRWAYQPYGLAATEGSGPQPPFTWVGAFGVVDLGQGTYLMKRRLYDAMAGRFIQRDPQGFDGGPNLYAYASLNPLALIDPGGLEGEDPEYVEQPVMEGTYDIITGEMPHESTEYEADKAMWDLAYQNTDKSLELYGKIPGAPHGNFINAGREYRDRGDTWRFRYEATKGVIGLCGPPGFAVAFTLDAGEMAINGAPEVKKTEEKARWTIVQGIYDWKRKVVQDFQNNLMRR